METSASNLLQSFMVLDVGLDERAYVAFVEQIGRDRANRFAWSIAKYFAELSDDELVHLVKLFTLLENSLQAGFCGGSTSQVCRLLAELRSRNRQRSDELSDWALQVALNPYNPFGTLNRSRKQATSTDEYLRLESLRHARICHVDANRKAEAERRAAARAARHAMRQAVHRETNEGRRAFLDELSRLSPVERLRRIARGDGHMIGSVPVVFADLSAVGKLTKAEQHALLGRLLRAPRGPWSLLRATIEPLDGCPQSGSPSRTP